jgi:hypothetical protein
MLKMLEETMKVTENEPEVQSSPERAKVGMKIRELNRKLIAKESETVLVGEMIKKWTEQSEKKGRELYKLKRATALPPLHASPSPPPNGRNNKLSQSISYGTKTTVGSGSFRQSKYSRATDKSMQLS